MCGIVAVIGSREAAPLLLQALQLVLPRLHVEKRPCCSRLIKS
jgi:hypothetical protein